MYVYIYTCIHYMSMYMCAYIGMYTYTFFEPLEKARCPFTHMHNMLFPQTKDYLIHTAQLLKLGC